MSTPPIELKDLKIKPSIPEYVSVSRPYDIPYKDCYLAGLCPHGHYNHVFRKRETAMQKFVSHLQKQRLQPAPNEPSK
jgi:hypothetical protein